MLGQKLIARILQDRDVPNAIRLRVDHLKMDEISEIQWGILKEHFSVFNECPSLNHFQTHLWPGYIHKVPEDSMSVLIDAISEENLGTDVDRSLCTISEINQTAPWEAKIKLRELADRVNSRYSREGTAIVAGEYHSEFLERKKEQRDGGGLLGLPFPWARFNEHSSGLRKGNVIYLYGRPKCRKTWAALWWALHYFHMGKKVLFFTRELNAEELQERIYCLMMR